MAFAVLCGCTNGGEEPTRAKTDNTCMCTDSIGFTREKRKLYTYQKVRGNPSPPGSSVENGPSA